MTDCASMVESIKVARLLWIAAQPRPSGPTALVRFTISWTMASGFHHEVTQGFNAIELLDLPMGALPMASLIYTGPYDGHPSWCTQGMVYLVRTVDDKGQPDVVARFVRKLNPHALGMVNMELLPANMKLLSAKAAGPHIFPLPIEEIRYPED